MQKNTGLALLIGGMFLAIGIAASGYFIGQTMINAKVGVNTAEAKGLAERRVEADHANWSISFYLTARKYAEVPALYKRAEATQQQLAKLLMAQGFKKDEIEFDVIDYSHREVRNKEQVVVEHIYSLTGKLAIETARVQLLKPARHQINKLIAQGIRISNHRPQYYFTKLNEIKPQMLQEATKNARIAASEFAKNAGAKVGGIRSARQGNFYIRDVGEEYGDSNKIEKTVRVVTNISFYLTE